MRLGVTLVRLSERMFIFVERSRDTRRNVSRLRSTRTGCFKRKPPNYRPVGSAYLRNLQPRPQTVRPDLERFAAPVGNEDGLAANARRDAGVVCGDNQPCRTVCPCFRRDRDEGRVIFLILALHKDIARDRADRTRGQVDHVIGRRALGVIKARIADRYAARIAFDIMAAAPALKAAAGDGE